MTSPLHEAYAADVRSKMKLVEHSLGSKDHPGFISLSALVKVIYLSNLDPVAYAPPLERLLYSNSDCFLDAAIDLVRQFYLNKCLCCCLCKGSCGRSS